MYVFIGNKIDIENFLALKKKKIELQIHDTPLTNALNTWKSLCSCK